MMASATQTTAMMRTATMGRFPEALSVMEQGFADAAGRGKARCAAAQAGS